MSDHTYTIYYMIRGVLGSNATNGKLSDICIKLNLFDALADYTRNLTLNVSHDKSSQVCEVKECILQIAHHRTHCHIYCVNPISCAAN